MEEIKRNFFNIVLNNIKNMKISNFILMKNNEKTIVNFSNYRNYTIIDLLKSDKVIISNKNSKILQKSKIDKKYINFMLENCLENTYDREFKIKLKNGVIFNFDISKHSQKMFIIRYFLFFKYFNKFCNQEFISNIKLFRTFFSENSINEEFYIKTNLIKEEMFKLISNATTFNEKSLYRRRDIKEFKKKEQKYESTTRMFNHPFMFVFSHNNLVTVELYSSSFSMGEINNKARKLEFNIKNIIDFNPF